MHLASYEPFQRVSQSNRIYLAVQFILLLIVWGVLCEVVCLWGCLFVCFGFGYCFFSESVCGGFTKIYCYTVNKWSLSSASIAHSVRTAVELMTGYKKIKIKVIFYYFPLLLWKKCRGDPVQKKIKINLNCNSYPQFKLLVSQLSIR